MSKVFIEDENMNILANANEEPFVVDQVGTDCFINGVRQNRLDFTSNPQEQLDAKQDKLSAAQLQAIGEVDAVKSIALQNQSDIVELDKQVTDKTDLTTLASKVETNTSAIDKRSIGYVRKLPISESRPIILENGNYFFLGGLSDIVTQVGNEPVNHYYYTKMFIITKENKAYWLTYIDREGNITNQVLPESPEQFKVWTGSSTYGMVSVLNEV